MQITKSVERADGTYVYTGVFTGPELDFLVEFACNQLMAIGAFPFVTEEQVEDGDVHPLHETEQ